MGGMIGNDDLDAIARLDFLCDDTGLDTINTGVSLAIAMDAGYKPFGGQSAVEMLEEIRNGSEVGRLLGSGPVNVGKYFNHHRVPAVKGQSVAAYDPRGIQGYGAMYATSTMGADHTCAPVLAENLAAFGGQLNPLRPEGQVDAVRNSMIGVSVVDSLGICLLASFSLSLPEGAQALLDMISAKLGIPFGADDLPKLGIRVLKAEYEFNRKAGFTSKDDRLPKFYYDEPLPPHNTKFLISDGELDSMYNYLTE
jgi:aldehyde:ferredoxin oxidoreductase